MFQFQSPLHRGTLFNKLAAKPAATPCQFQSPLHRGTLFNAGNHRSGRELHAFQSPLHRGTLFNRRQTKYLHPLAYVSVPSSSGNSLQRFAQPAIRLPVQRFSPLFIGELSSTKRRACFHSAWTCFSPLFIGELSSTPASASGEDNQ